MSRLTLNTGNRNYGPVIILLTGNMSVVWTLYDDIRRITFVPYLVFRPLLQKCLCGLFVPDANTTITALPTSMDLYGKLLDEIVCVKGEIWNELVTLL